MSKNEIDAIDLGNLIIELENIAELKKLFYPKPIEIRISQWRNIAYHHNAIIKNKNLIECTYGKGKNKKSFSATFAEISQTLQNLIYFYNSLKLGREIFLLDNLNELSKARGQDSAPLKIRSENTVLAFYTAFSKADFKVIELSINNDSAEAIIQDETENKVKDRAIYSSQLLYQLWWQFRKKNLKMQYNSLNNEPVLISETTEDVCELIGRGDKPMSYLAEVVKFTFLKPEVFDK